MDKKPKKIERQNKKAGIIYGIIAILFLVISFAIPFVIIIAIIMGILSLYHLKSKADYKPLKESAHLYDMIRGFNEWDQSVHLVEGQDGRFYRALYDGIITIGKKYPARILSPSGHTYKTSLKECTCPDFEKRHLPCKHMYRLALDCGIIDENFIYSPFLPEDVFDNTNPPDNKYQNYATYKIKGVSKETHRKNTKVIEARNREDVVKAADTIGLVEPIEILQKVEESGPTEKQIEAAKNYNLLYPSDISSQDMSYLLERASNKQRADIPNVEFAQYADQIGVHFSRMIDPNSLNNKVFEKLSDMPRERLAIYAYICFCKKGKKPIGNLNDFLLQDKCYQFADEISDNNRNYIFSLTYEQFYKPNASATAYKTAIKTLEQ